MPKLVAVEAFQQRKVVLRGGHLDPRASFVGGNPYLFQGLLLPDEVGGRFSFGREVTVKNCVLHPLADVPEACFERTSPWRGHYQPRDTDGRRIYINSNDATTELKRPLARRCQTPKTDPRLGPPAVLDAQLDSGWAPLASFPSICGRRKVHDTRLAETGQPTSQRGRAQAELTAFLVSILSRALLKAYGL